MSDENQREAELRASLLRTLGSVCSVYSSDLVAHLKRDAVIVVDTGISLIDCAVAVALDDKAKVAQWLSAGALRRATDDERAQWPSEPTREWLAVVVQPFVLVQTPSN
jgi:hypothetical protein